MVMVTQWPNSDSSLIKWSLTSEQLGTIKCFEQNINLKLVVQRDYFHDYVGSDDVEKL